MSRIPAPLDYTHLANRLTRVERAIETIGGQRRLQSASIGSGGLRVLDGGTLEVLSAELDRYVKLAAGEITLLSDLGQSGATPARVRSSIGEASGRASLFIYPPVAAGFPTTATRLVLEGASSGFPGGVWLYSGGLLTLRAVNTASMRTENGFARVAVNPDGSFAASTVASAGGSLVTNVEGSNQWGLDLFAASGGSREVWISSTTGSGSANVRLDGAYAALIRVSSSRRYKTAIADADIDPAAILALRPRTWLDRGELARGGRVVDAKPAPRAEPEQGGAVTLALPDGLTPPPRPKADAEPKLAPGRQLVDGRDVKLAEPRRYVGFVAEELHEGGLGQFVEYDEQGRPDAIAYDRLTAGLVTVAQQQQRQLDAQAAELAELRATVGALAARVDALDGAGS